jgi:hypothetical protein
MNYTISVIFRLIPVLMAGVCVGLGIFTWSTSHSIGGFVSGHVLIFLGAVCLCLFATASVIIRQLIGALNLFDKIFYPTLGYTLAIGTVIVGFLVMNSSDANDAFVAGHVVFGLGMICFCVSTVATASICFKRIPQNSALPAGTTVDKCFPPAVAVILVAVPVIAAVVTWTWALYLIFTEKPFPHFIAGHVMAGLAMICTSLIGLVVSVVKQIDNTYTEFDRRSWPALVIVMGAAAIVWGLLLLIFKPQPFVIAPGFVMIGLGMICYSILSKVLLLALVWRRTFALANRIPLLPVGTALTCLFTAAFLAQASDISAPFFIPAHVLAGLGAICFSLFSIVSILESGTSKT